MNSQLANRYVEQCGELNIPPHVSAQNTISELDTKLSNAKSRVGLLIQDYQRKEHQIRLILDTTANNITTARRTNIDTSLLREQAVWDARLQSTIQTRIDIETMLDCW